MGYVSLPEGIHLLGELFHLFENTGSVTKDQMRINTWRIIPLSKWLGSPPFIPFISAMEFGHLEGVPQPFLETLPAAMKKKHP